MFSLFLMWFKIEEVRKENLQANLSEKSQTGDRHAHVNSQSSRSITSKLFPQIDTRHNTESEGLTFVMHHVKDRGFTLSSLT
jgi:hypothetical protein